MNHADHQPIIGSRKLTIIAEAELVPHLIRNKCSIQPYCQKAVLAVLANYDGQLVSRRGIEARTGLSTASIGHAFIALEARKLIRSSGWQRQKYRAYTINWGALEKMATKEHICCPPSTRQAYEKWGTTGRGGRGPRAAVNKPKAA